MSRADNLIPLRPSLSGPQLAGWEPGPPAMQGLGCRLLSDQRIDVEPGVVLAPDVYLPQAGGRYPAVVSFAVYSKELHTAGVPTGSNEIGGPPVFTDRGYARVVLSRRGMGRSVREPGVFLGDSDVADMNATIAWAAEQPWCNGDVVMFGTSYYGMSQPLINARARIARPTPSARPPRQRNRAIPASPSRSAQQSSAGWTKSPISCSPCGRPSHAVDRDDQGGPPASGPGAQHVVRDRD